MNKTIPTYNGPIAILDMLGFKKYVLDTPLQTVINEYSHILTAASFSAEVMQGELEFMVYSDTIAIRPLSATEKCFDGFIRALQLISYNYFNKIKVPGYNTLPIRGAIAYGEYSWHKGDISTQVPGRKLITAGNLNFIVGKAIIDSHELENKQEWFGISFDKKTGDILKEKFPIAFEKLEKEKCIIEEKIPGKEGDIDGYIINPTERSTFLHSFKDFCDICSNHINENVGKKVIRKYINTLRLIRKIYDNNDLWPKWNDDLLQKIPRQNIDMSLCNSLLAGHGY